MKGTINKWGNSAAIRIPASLMKSIKLDVDEVVEIRQENGCIVIEPVRRKVYDIDDLIGGLTSRNLHEETDFGEPLGKEIW